MNPINQTFYIYTICHKTNPELGQYIGSTTNLSLRRNNHKCFYNKGRHYNSIYKIMSDNGGWDEWEMKVLKTAETHEEMVRIENEMIRNLPMVLNKRIAFVENYKEYSRIQHHNYYYSHLEENRAKARERYHKKKQCNCIGQNDSSINQITSEGQTV